MNWSFQLYSARNFMPWAEVAAMLGDLGYSEVEGFGGVYDDAAGFRALLDGNGLTMPSGHFSIEALEGDFDGVCKTADVLGIKHLICPYLDVEQRPGDGAGWSALGERLARIGETARQRGYDFAWHNHDFEFAELDDGSVPMEHILLAAPAVGWEIDVAWVVRAGNDPLAWIERYGERIVAVHVKDIAKAGEGLDEDGWADVGHGVIDWAALLMALRARANARHFVMEHDNPTDIERFARRSILAMNELAGDV